MFTAIAMVAFAGISMANTIEINDKLETFEVETLDSDRPKLDVLRLQIL